MSQIVPNDRRFKWSGQSEQAAQLIAAGDLSLTEIAERLEVDRRTLHRWRQAPEFASRVDQHIEEIRREIRRHGIGVVERRVTALDDRWRRLQRVMDERGAAPEMADVPGGSTGLLVRRVKRIGAGPSVKTIEEFAVDTRLLSELREHEKQAAQELGQWMGKPEATRKGEPIGCRVVVVRHYERPGSPPDSGNSPTADRSGPDH